ncbi:MAG: hypothetical protein JRF33_05250 [Deltaproteobacteria bacterium]|nr:hypothetical protein [Deltaproteobacteria bacterium]
MLLNDDMKLDKRIIERNIRSGVVGPKEFNKHIKKLKDLSSESEKIEAELERISHQLPASPETDEDEL